MKEYVVVKDIMPILTDDQIEKFIEAFEKINRQKKVFLSYDE